MGDKIIEIIKENRSIQKAALYQRVAEELVEVNPSTLSRYLKGKGYRKWIAKKRPKLTAAHAAARLRWAIKRDWTEEQWLNYIWSDEGSDEKGSTVNSRYKHTTSSPAIEKDTIYA